MINILKSIFTNHGDFLSLNNSNLFFRLMIETDKNWNTGWFFDLDGTLINPIFENKGDFKRLLIKSNIPEMICIFEKIKAFDDVYILTGRDLIMKNEISAYLQISPERVITKDIYLGEDDMKKVNNSEEKKKKKIRNNHVFEILRHAV